jgi:uncharacterized pyridoxal phosphate-containing UPF0001 family protein
MPAEENQANALKLNGKSRGEIDLSERLNHVLARIHNTAEACGRSPDEVTLVAVSKTHAVDRIGAAIVAGHRVFGENRRGSPGVR